MIFIPYLKEDFLYIIKVTIVNHFTYKRNTETSQFSKLLYTIFNIKAKR